MKATARSDVRLAVAAWVITRSFVLVMTALYFDGDTGTYHRYGRLWLDGQVPYRDFGVEYPPAAVAVFAALAAVGSFTRFRFVFALLCLGLDAVIFVALQRDLGQRGPGAAQPRTRWGPGLLWSVTTACLFPVLYVRFDLLPAAATVLAAGVLAPPEAIGRGRAAAAGALLGLAVALKLYPLVLLPFLVLHLRGDRARPRALLVGAAAGVAVIGLSFVPVLLAGAGARALSFLRYQGERGLQVESSYAGVLLVGKALFGLDLHPAFSHGAHDVVGPLAVGAAALAKLLQPAALLAMTALALHRRLSWPRACAALLATAILTANVFSPQFLLWLLPFACAVNGRTGGNGRGRRWDRVLPVVVCGLTTLLYPVLYPALTEGRPGAALILCGRNLLLAVMLVRFFRRGERLA